MMSTTLGRFGGCAVRAGTCPRKANARAIMHKSRETVRWHGLFIGVALPQEVTCDFQNVRIVSGAMLSRLRVTRQSGAAGGPRKHAPQSLVLCHSLIVG